MEAIAKLQKTRISPQKARLIADLIRGKNAEIAINNLRFMPKKGARIIRKLIEIVIHCVRISLNVPCNDQGWCFTDFIFASQKSSSSHQNKNQPQYPNQNVHCAKV